VCPPSAQEVEQARLHDAGSRLQCGLERLLEPGEIRDRFQGVGLLEFRPQRFHPEPGRADALPGGFGGADDLQQALDAGAAGVQVGTAFGYCVESGLRDDYKQAILEQVARGAIRVMTDPLASPSGFPFKVVQLEGTISESSTFLARPRICDLGYLREAYRTPNGQIGYRCPAEPESLYRAKGGAEGATEGRKCICNALMATAGFPQSRSRGRLLEAGIVTSGDDLPGLVRFMHPGSTSYTAEDVIRVLLGGRTV